MVLDRILFLAASSVEGKETPVEPAVDAFGLIIKGLSSVDDIVSTILKMLTAVMISIIIIQLFRLVYRRKWKKRPPDIRERFFYNIISILMYIVAILIVIAQLPEGEKIVAGIIGSSGFIALGLGLAAQESLSNVVNGMMISASKPFQVGDRIQLVNGKITGTVEDITLRHTVIKTFINSRIIVPNSIMNKEMIENSNYQQGRASSFIDVVIVYDSDIDIAIKIIEDAIGQHPDFLDIRGKNKKNKPKVKVFVRDLGINGVGLRASMWTSSVDNNFDASSDVRYSIFKEFQKNRIIFAQIPGRAESWLPEFNHEYRNTSHGADEEK